MNRVWSKRGFWRSMIGRQADSGLSAASFCRNHGLNIPLFYFWRRRLAQRDKPNPFSNPPMFLPVHVVDGVAADSDRAQERLAGHRYVCQEANDSFGGCIEIILPSGPTLRLVGPVDRQSLADVLEVLSRPVERASC